MCFINKKSVSVVNLKMKKITFFSFADKKSNQKKKKKNIQTIFQLIKCYYKYVF